VDGALRRLAPHRRRCIFSRVTPLDKNLKRLVKIKGDDFVITLTPDALKVTRKGHHRGIEMRWESLVSGESALAVALQASVGKFDVRKAELPRVAASPNTRSAPANPTKRPRPPKRRGQGPAKSR